MRVLGEKGRSRKKGTNPELVVEETNRAAIKVTILGLVVGLVIIVVALFKLMDSAISAFDTDGITVESIAEYDGALISNTGDILHLNYPGIVDTLNYVGMQGGKSNLGIVGGVADVIEVGMLFTNDGTKFTLGETGISTERVGKLIYNVDVYNNTAISSKYSEVEVMIGSYAEDTLSSFLSSHKLTDYLETGDSHYLGYTDDENKLNRLSGTYFDYIGQTDNIRVRQSREESGVFREYREGITALDGFEDFNSKLLVTRFTDGSFFRELEMPYVLGRLTESEKKVWNNILSNIISGNEVQMTIGIIPDDLLKENEKAEHNKFQTSYVEFTTELVSGNSVTLHLDGFDKFNQKRLSYVSITTEKGKDKLLTQETADIMTLKFNELSDFIRTDGADGSLLLEDNIKIGYTKSETEGRENFAGIVYSVGELY